MNNKTALIFPGQGAQKVGMGLAFYQQSPEAKAIFDVANSIIGHDFTKVIFEGPEEKLTSTAYCQPAILTMSVAVLKAFENHPKYKDIDVVCTAGLSLGEYSALVAAGVLDFAQALRLVQQRANFMEEATQENQGAMAAVIGFDSAQLIKICQETGAEIANYNSLEQIVITGEANKVNAAIVAIKAAGGQKVIPLTVSGAFHSSLMTSAALKFKNVLNDIAILPSHIKVLSNVNAKPHEEGTLRDNLASQITSSVQWVNCIKYMETLGVNQFIEIGPGKVLKGLMRRINPALSVTNIENPQDL